MSLIRSETGEVYLKSGKFHKKSLKFSQKSSCFILKEREKGRNAKSREKKSRK